MPYFALIYEVADDFIDKRTPYRPEHLQMAREAEARGELVMAGALGEPAGALLVFRADDRSVAEAFAAADPYVTAGLVTRWQVRPWTVVIGSAGSAPAA
ncbi:MAG: YciI-like protein [Acidobacteriota bacterium]|nr:YciI-like protein [Acidobacteriota bacterium]